MLNLYVGSSHRLVVRCRGMSARLAAIGYKIVSKWLDRPIGYGGEQSDRAKLDVEELQQADALVVILDHETGKASHAEMGFALGRGIPIHVVGEHLNMLCFHPVVKRHKSDYDLVQWMLDDLLAKLPTCEVCSRKMQWDEVMKLFRCLCGASRETSQKVWKVRIISDHVRVCSGVMYDLGSSIKCLLCGDITHAPH